MTVPEAEGGRSWVEFRELNAGVDWAGDALPAALKAAGAAAGA